MTAPTYRNWGCGTDRADIACETKVAARRANSERPADAEFRGSARRPATIAARDRARNDRDPHQFEKSRNRAPDAIGRRCCDVSETGADGAMLPPRRLADCARLELARG